VEVSVRCEGLGDQGVERGACPGLGGGMCVAVSAVAAVAAVAATTPCLLLNMPHKYSRMIDPSMVPRVPVRSKEVTARLRQPQQNQLRKIHPPNGGCGEGEEQVGEGGLDRGDESGVG